MKRDLLFVAERLASLLDENRLAVVARQHGIRKAKDCNSIGKLFAAYLRRTEESALGSILVELTIVLSSIRNNATQMLREAATMYKIDTDAITQQVRQEFAAKQGKGGQKACAESVTDHAKYQLKRCTTTNSMPAFSPAQPAGARWGRNDKGHPRSEVGFFRSC